jgi:hypothetical protein
MCISKSDIVLLNISVEILFGEKCRKSMNVKWIGMGWGNALKQVRKATVFQQSSKKWGLLKT